MEHKSGYMVWAYAEKWWHRTKEAAERHAIKLQNYCSNVQVIECKSGKLASGRPE